MREAQDSPALSASAAVGFWVLLLAVSLSHTAMDPFLRAGMALVSGGGLVGVGRDRGLGRWLWLAATALVAGYVFGNFHAVGNHSFVLLWTVLLLTLHQWLPPGPGESGLRWGSRALILVIMSFAVLQKFLVPYYTSGLLLADFALSGSLPGWLFAGVDGFEEAVEAHRAVAVVLLQHPDPHASVAAALPGDGFLFRCRVISWAGIIAEVLIVLAFCFPARRFAVVQGVTVLVTAVGIFLLRGAEEATFLALFALLVALVIRPAWRSGGTFLLACVYALALLVALNPV